MRKFFDGLSFADKLRTAIDALSELLPSKN